MQVTENYMNHLKEGELSELEIPNMITKWYTIIAAHEMAKANKRDLNNE